jgi:peptidoglycan/LPS O-acetylase OafA/YrhL
MPSLIPQHFGKEDVQVCKGVAIILIVLHNYCHLVRPNPGNNEFNFDPNRIVALLGFLRAQPGDSFNLFFSYFGHYGVQVFLFLSAYGLMRSYRDRIDGWWAFMWRRVDRIYPTFLLAVAAYLIFIVTPWNPDIAWYLKTSLVELSLLSSVWPGHQLQLVGPWWFFSVIFQFYALFPLLRRITIRYGGEGLIMVGVTGLVFTYLANPVLVSNGINLKLTLIGHLPTLCLGLYLARAEDLSIPTPVLLAAAGVFIAGNWLAPYWYLAPICIATLFVAGLGRGIVWLRKWGPGYRFVEYCGYVSLPLFAIHGIMRDPFVREANAYGTWYVTLTLGAIYFVAALAAAQAMLSIEGFGRKLLARARALTP